MQTVFRLVLAAAVFGAAVRVNAGEPARPPQRPLLQPPKLVVASPITDRFAVRALYFHPTVINSVRYDDSDGNRGTLFGASSQLGMKDETNQGWMDLMFRLGPRHRIQADYYRLKRTGDHELAVPIEFGDTDYDVGERILSGIDLRTLGVNYLFSAIHRETVEVSLGIGIHLLQVDAFLEAPARFAREEADAAGPFPSLVFDGTWRFTRRFSLYGSMQYLSAGTSKADAVYLTWRGNLQFRAWRNLALGVGYASTRYSVDSTDTGRSGYMNLWYHGPEAFLQVSF